MKKHVVWLAVTVYGIGWIVDYSWYIAHGVHSALENPDYVAGACAGWLFAIFWPAHLLSFIW